MTTTSSGPDHIYDLIVVGGGITGAGVARDAALRGLSTLLLEKRDFASGVSSKTTRLVHGGLRYLANFELDLVAEALRERAILRRHCPYLITPMPILIPICQKLGIDLVHFGLVMVLNLMIGLLHPPMGTVLFVLSRVAKLSIERTTVAILPWLVPLLITLGLSIVLENAALFFFTGDSRNITVSYSDRMVALGPALVPLPKLVSFAASLLLCGALAWFIARTDTGRAHELWRRLREVGRDFGLRELGFKAQMIGHTETGIATVIRDYIPDRGSLDQLRKMMRYWMSAEELEAAEWNVAEHLCSPAELGWGHAVNPGKRDFHGKAAVEEQTPRWRLMGLEWSSEDMAELYAAQFRDAPSAPPPDLPAGQFRVFFLRVRDGGWASGYAYSPTLRRMISLARLDRGIQPGDKVQVRWGGFSDEPACTIRATVRALPFIAQQRTKNLS